MLPRRITEPAHKSRPSRNVQSTTIVRVTTSADREDGLLRCTQTEPRPPTFLCASHTHLCPHRSHIQWPHHAPSRSPPACSLMQLAAISNSAAPRSSQPRALAIGRLIRHSNVAPRRHVAKARHCLLVPHIARTAPSQLPHSTASRAHHATLSAPCASRPEPSQSAAHRLHPPCHLLPQLCHLLQHCPLRCLLLPPQLPSHRLRDKRWRRRRELGSRRWHRRLRLSRQSGRSGRRWP